MAGAFDAKVVINTSEATTNLRALNREVGSTAVTLKMLDKALNSTQKDLTATANALTAIVASQRQAAQGTKELANAQVASARADGIAIVNANKIAESNAKVAESEARRARTTQLTQAATDKKTATDLKQAAATKKVNDRTLELNDSLSNSRYLLYDVGATYSAMSLALMAIPAATAAVSIAYQKDFAQVIRTTNDGEGVTIGLRNELKGLATDIPLAFSDLTAIATLGGQLDVAEDRLASFTETVAKFVATSDGVTTEAAGTIFGRLENTFNANGDLPDFFNKIGAAISYVGTNSVATEPEIINLLNQIAPLGKNIGMTAEETVGLAGALASLRVRPELARGTLTRVFADLNRAVDTGGPMLDAYARLMNKTASEAATLWKQKPAAFFQEFVGGLSAARAGGENLTAVFDDLGLKATRDVDMLTKLSVGYHVLSKSMADAGEAYTLGTALDDMSGPVFETVAAKLKTMANAFMNLADSIGSSSLAPMVAVIDIIKGIVTGIDNAIQTVPAIHLLVNALMALSGIAAVFLGVKAAQAFALAGIVGFQQIAGKPAIAGAMSLSGILKQLSVTFLMVGGASQKAATDMVFSTSAMHGAAVAADRASVSTTRTAVAMGGKLAGAARAAGSAFMAMGGPVGVLVLALAGLMMNMGAVRAQADQMKESVANAFTESDAAGAKALAQALQTKPEGFFADLTNNFATNGKSVKSIAESIGIDFATLTDAAMGSAKAIEKAQAAKDAFAQSKGFDDQADLMDARKFTINPDTIGAADAMKQLDDALYGYTTKADEAKQKTAEVDSVIEELGLTGEDAGEGIGSVTDAVDDMTAALDAAMSSIFGLINNEMALNEALSKIGAGLQESGSFSTSDEAGRNNIANVQAAADAAMKNFMDLQVSGELSVSEAAESYAAFIDGLIGQIRDNGGDMGPIADMVNATKLEFETALNAGQPSRMPVEADADMAKAELDRLQAEYGTLDSTVLVKEEGGQEVASRIAQLEAIIIAVTGQPYTANVDADTSTANENVKNTEAYMTRFLGIPFMAYVDADASPAQRALQAFGQWAQTALAHIGNTFIKVQNLISGMRGGPKLGLMAVPDFSPAAPNRQVASRVPLRVATPAPKQVKSTPQQRDSGDTGYNGDAMRNGYDAAGAKDREKAAKDSGKAAKDAAKAEKDAAKDTLEAMREKNKAMREAAKEVESYASRLKTALSGAFDKKYEMQNALDAYNTALNTAAKKREDELKSLADLIQKQKELNNARNEDLIEGRKAKTEQGISLKYGEFDRAEDYGQQAKTSFDNAAAKQVEIEAAKKEHDEIKVGIGLMTGYTQAAIDNRAAVQDLEKKMMDMVVAYANTGKSQQQTEAYARSLSASLAVQVEQSNRNINAAAAHEAAMDAADAAADAYAKSIEAIPDAASTTADNNFDSGVSDAGALANAFDAVPDYLSTTHETKRKYTYTGGLNELPGNKASNYQPIYKAPGGGLYFNKGGSVPRFNDGGLVPGTPPSDPSADNIMASIDGKRGAMIRSGEFIQPEPAVDYYGTDFMNKIRTMQLPRFNAGGGVGSGRTSGSAGGNAPVLMELTAENLAFLARVLDRPINLLTENELIASSANAGNRILASKGMN